MPPQLLLEYSHLDFSRPQMKRADIDAVIPHRGSMALIDAVVSLDPERRALIGYKDVRANEFWCDGHFPDNPILPGVVMIEASGQLAVLGYRLFVPEVRHRLVVFGGVDEVRFRGVVRPGQRLVLLAVADQVNQRLAKCRTQAVVDGKVVYEGIVLGIPT